MINVWIFINGWCKLRTWSKKKEVGAPLELLTTTLFLSLGDPRSALGLRTLRDTLHHRKNPSSKTVKVDSIYCTSLSECLQLVFLQCFLQKLGEIAISSSSSKRSPSNSPSNNGYAADSIAGSGSNQHPDTFALQTPCFQRGCQSCCQVGILRGPWRFGWNGVSGNAKLIYTNVKHYSKLYTLSYRNGVYIIHYFQKMSTYWKYEVEWNWYLNWYLQPFRLHGWREQNPRFQTPAKYHLIPIHLHLCQSHLGGTIKHRANPQCGASLM